MVSSIVGILIGASAPDAWGLNQAAYFALLAVLIPMVHRIPVAAGVVVTAVIAVATVEFPMRLGLFLAVVAGVAVAVGVETLRPQGAPHGVAEVAHEISEEGEVA
jgi:predicted branched-subunit amino acid permease